MNKNAASTKRMTPINPVNPTIKSSVLTMSNMQTTIIVTLRINLMPLISGCLNKLRIAVIILVKPKHIQDDPRIIHIAL